MKVEDLFTIKTAKSKGNEDYDLGDIPYVSSTTVNNGVLKFVEPFDDDKVFDGNVICISGLGFATSQLNRFLPKGNGGDSATILIPKIKMTLNELIYYTALFNLLHSWRFSFGRKGNKARIANLKLIPFSSYDNRFESDFSNFIDLFQGKVSEYRTFSTL
jgi:Type I restriction modification DNA specificity domain